LPVVVAVEQTLLEQTARQMVLGVMAVTEPHLQFQVHP
jgi:hypothetical protein